MIAFIVGASILGGVGLGWYGYKAVLRIEIWGQGMNECDAIFQAMSQGEIGGELPQSRSRGRAEEPEFGRRHFPIGAAASK